MANIQTGSVQIKLECSNARLDKIKQKIRDELDEKFTSIDEFLDSLDTPIQMVLFKGDISSARSPEEVVDILKQHIAFSILKTKLEKMSEKLLSAVFDKVAKESRGTK